MISSFVAFIPSLLRRPTFLIVASAPFVTIPSPARNSCPRIYILYPSIPASTACAIFAAQEAFAPSHTIPDTTASALTTVCVTSSNPPPQRYAIPAPAAAPAEIAPQYALRRPIPVF